MLRKEQKDDFDWLIAQQKKTNGDGSSSVSDTDTSGDSAPKNGHKSKSHKSSKNSPKKNSKTHRTVTGNEKDGTGPCGGCGNSVGPVHKCDICERNMHPFCGRTIGEEGYGSAVRCPECDRSAK